MEEHVIYDVSREWIWRRASRWQDLQYNIDHEQVIEPIARLTSMGASG